VLATEPVRQNVSKNVRIAAWYLRVRIAHPTAEDIVRQANPQAQLEFSAAALGVLAADQSRP
jgi:hypothetical protein